MEQTFYLDRFLNAQNDGLHGSTYEKALSEIRNGGKSTHWIWYVFPQIKGIPGGHSYNTIHYAIINREEAKQYAEHPILGARLREITQALLDLPYRPIINIMGGNIDALKLRSCMTLFYYATHDPIFKRLIDRYFFSTFDPITHRLLAGENTSK